MSLVIVGFFSFLSTLLGGLVALRYKNKFHLILGFTAGVLLAVVAFDILPEITKLVRELNTDPIQPMIALVVGFLIFHILEKLLLIHHAHEDNYADHKHPAVGVFSALALAGHAFLDGLGIALGFKVSPSVGILIAMAVISHNFADGLNTISLALVNRNTTKRALLLLIAVALAPVLGIVSGGFLTLPDNILVFYLGFFAGFLLYIGAAEILPEAHSKHSSVGTILMTVLGVILIFLVSQIIILSQYHTTP